MTDLLEDFAGRSWLRVSIQGYNTLEDVSRLVTAVKDLTEEIPGA